MKCPALEVIDIVLKALALVVGSLWTILLYMRGRTFKGRLEPGISGNVHRNRETLWLSGTAVLKNVGLSKVPIPQKGTAIQIFVMRLDLGQQRLISSRLRTLSVFTRHAWVEPGETISESFSLLLPERGSCLGASLKLRIVSTSIFERVEWNCDTTVPIEEIDKK